jgi:hypothetical protein
MVTITFLQVSQFPENLIILVKDYKEISMFISENLLLNERRILV